MPIIQDTGEIDNSNYLLSKQELQDQRRDYIILFSRVLVEYFPCLKSIKSVMYLITYSVFAIQYSKVAPCNGIRNPESREIFLLESGIQDIFQVGIRNPVSWNPESTKVLESGIYLCRNPLVSNCLGRFFHFSTQSPFSGLPLTLLHLRHSKHVFELVHAGHTSPRGGYFPLDVSFKAHATKKMLEDSVVDAFECLHRKFF